MLNVIAEELTQHIDGSYARHLVTPDTMFLVQARDEIIRLDTALDVCHVEVERLYKMLNEIRHMPGRAPALHAVRSEPA